jgi:hypothetical protein
VGAAFINTQSGTTLWVTLIEVGHKQPATPLRTDNSTAFGILNETINQKRSKAMDMRYRCEFGNKAAVVVKVRALPPEP